MIINKTALFIDGENLRHYVENVIFENGFKKGNKTLICKEFLVMDPDGYLLRFAR